MAARSPSKPNSGLGVLRVRGQKRQQSRTHVKAAPPPATEYQCVNHDHSTSRPSCVSASRLGPSLAPPALTSGLSAYRPRGHTAMYPNPLDFAAAASVVSHDCTPSVKVEPGRVVVLVATSTLSM